MQQYYLVKFKEAIETEKGLKWKSDSWLVLDVSVTAAEAAAVKELATYGTDYEITGISLSKNTKVLEA